MGNGEQPGDENVSEIRAASRGVTRAEARWLMFWSFLSGVGAASVVITGAVIWEWWSRVTWVF